MKKSTSSSESDPDQEPTHKLCRMPQSVQQLHRVAGMTSLLKNIEKTNCFYNNLLFDVQMVPPSIWTKCFLDSSEVIITIEGFKFNPSELYVRSGTRITWKVKANKAVYNSLYDNSGSRFFIVGVTQIEEESSPIHENESFSIVVEQTGTFEMKCLNYTRMKGEIIVVDKSINLIDIIREQKQKISQMEQVDAFKYNNKQKKEVEISTEISKPEASNTNTIQDDLRQEQNQKVGAYSQKQEIINLRENMKSNIKEVANELIQKQDIISKQSGIKRNSHYLQLYKDDFKEEIDEEDGEEFFSNNNSSAKPSNEDQIQSKCLNSSSKLSQQSFDEVSHEQATFIKNKILYGIGDSREQHSSRLKEIETDKKSKKQRINSKKKSTLSNANEGYYSGYEEEEEEEEDQKQFDYQREQKQLEKANEDEQCNQSEEQEEDDTQYDCNTIISEEDQSVNTSKDNSFVIRVANSQNNLRSPSGSVSNRSFKGPARSLDRRVNNIKKSHRQIKYKNSRIHPLSSAESSKYSDTTKQHSQKGDYELEAIDIKGISLCQKINQKRRASTDQTIQETRQANSNNGHEDSDIRSIKSLKNEPISLVQNTSQGVLLPHEQLPSLISPLQIETNQNVDNKESVENKCYHFSENSQENKFVQKDYQSMIRGISQSREGGEFDEDTQTSGNIFQFIQQKSKIILQQFSKITTPLDTKNNPQHEEASQCDSQQYEKLQIDSLKDEKKEMQIGQKLYSYEDCISSENIIQEGFFSSPNPENLINKALQEEIKFVSQFLLQRYEVESWLLEIQEEDGDVDVY